MGELRYGPNGSAFEFEDRLLHHLRLVITSKLRRGESFTFTWQTSSCGAGVSLWLHPSIPLCFTFARLTDVRVNKEWVERLSLQANSPAGLTLIDEAETRV